MKLPAIHRLVLFYYYFLSICWLPIATAFTMRNKNKPTTPQKPLVINDTDLDRLVERCRTLQEKHSQVWIGVAGPPGSGKSTLANKLCKKLGAIATILPMDGYHIPKEKLSQADFQRRGAPWTFDAAQFVCDIKAARLLLFGRF